MPPNSIRRLRSAKDSAALLRNLMMDHGITQHALATACGVSQSLVAKWLDSNSTSGPQLADLWSFPAELVEGVIASLTGRDGRQIASPNEQFHVVAKEVGESLSALAEATATGPDLLTEALRIRVRRETREAIIALRGALCTLDQQH